MHWASLAKAAVTPSPVGKGLSPLVLQLVTIHLSYRYTLGQSRHSCHDACCGADYAISLYLHDTIVRHATTNIPPCLQLKQDHSTNCCILDLAGSNNKTSHIPTLHTHADPAGQVANSTVVFQSVILCKTDCHCGHVTLHVYASLSAL